MMKYHKGEEFKLSPVLDIVFFNFEKQFVRDQEKYKKACDRNRKNGEKGGRPLEETRETQNNPLGYSETQSPPVAPYSDSDSDNKNKKEKINKKEKSEILFFENLEEQEELVAHLSEEKGVLPDIARAEIKKFISYWTEKNTAGTKQRWQMEKVFEVKRRLATWFSNAGKFQKPSGKSSQSLSF